jgi:hypothetical protein
MLTIFTIPKAFVGRTAVLQRNAIRSWTQLGPACEVILFGNDPGVEEAARSLGVGHVPAVETNEHATPLLNSVFGIAQKVAANDLMMYVNADILFFPEMLGALSRIDLPQFLLCGRRRDLDVDKEIDFGSRTWTDDLRRQVEREGRWHGISGIDYFVFRRGLVEMRPFAVGRPGWDNWLIFDTRRKGIPVIDASDAIEAVHQNHDFTHSTFGEKTRVGGPEYQGNIRIAGGFANALTLRDATWLLTPDGPARIPFPRAIWPVLSLWYPWRLVLGAFRRARS